MKAGKQSTALTATDNSGALFQRQERALSASGLNLDFGNTEVKAWLFSSVHHGSCYVCVQLTGS